MKRLGAAIAALLLMLALLPRPGVAAEVDLRDTVTVQVVRKARNAVVSITARRFVTRRVNPFPGDPFWQQFNLGQIVRVPADFLGSGIIVQKTGYIVTNNHVIAGAKSIHVKLSSGKTYSARLIGTDPAADLAVLKISGKTPFPTLTLGDSASLMIGEPAIAVGNPFGFSESVSSGIVSAIHRDLNHQADHSALHDLIQTDAAINPGNSGGPLLNAYAQVIGINTAIRGGAQNIGFAIGVNRLRRLIPELMDPALVNGVDTGFKLHERCALTLPAQLHLQLFVNGISSPVAAIDGVTPANIVDAYAILLGVTPAQKVVTVKFANGVVKRYPVSKSPWPPVVILLHRMTGLRVEQVTPALAQRQGLAVKNGLLITKIDHNSLAAKAGLHAGDILIQIGGYPVRTLQALQILLPHVPPDVPVRVIVVRGRHLAAGNMRF